MRLANCCEPSAPRVYKIKLDTGTVGILGLDLIMAGMRSMEPLTAEETKNKLFKRAAASNYIPVRQGKICRGFVQGIRKTN